MTEQHFRVYILDGENHITGRIELAAPDLADAIPRARDAIARQYREQRPMEIWQGKQKLYPCATLACLQTAA